MRDSGGACRQFAPQNLHEALPNRTYTVPGRATFTFSDVALLGQVRGIEKGPAFAHAGDDNLVPVDFDDPSAAEWSVQVHVAVDELFGTMEPTRELTFRMGLLNAPDRDLFVDGMGSLGRTAVVLTRRQDRDDEVLIPSEQGALIGRIDGLGRLRFPGLGAEEHGFVVAITTVDAFRAAASEDQRLVILDPDLFH